MDVTGKPAVPVKEDRVIRTIRAVKKAFGIAQMNELYVCEADVQKHLDRRRSFEKSMLFASVFSGLIVLILLAALVLSGRFDPFAFVSAIVLALFVLALPLFKYAPALEGMPTGFASGKKAQPAPAPVAVQAPPAAAAQPEEKAEPKKRKSRPKKEVK